MMKTDNFAEKKKTSFTLSAEAYELLTEIAKTNRRDRTAELEMMIREKAQKAQQDEPHHKNG